MSENGMGVENSTDFMLAPGEQNVYGEKFLASILAPYLKAQMMCSSSRFVFKVPNSLLGFIPIGSVENTMPIRNIAAVSSTTSFRLGRFVIGLILAIAGFVMFKDSVVGGILCLLLGAALLVTAFPARLNVQNAAGGMTSLEVSIFDKAKLARFTQELQNRVFADLDQVRHQEAQATRLDAAQMQQQQMQQQMALQQQMLQQMQVQGMQQQQQNQQPGMN